MVPTVAAYVDGRPIPFSMKLIPEDEPGEYTEMTYELIEFDVELDASMFTLQGLRN